MTEETITTEKKKKKKWLLLLILLLVVALGAGLYWFFFQRNKMDDTSKYWFDKMAKDGTLEGKSQEELQDILDRIMEEGMFNASINAEPVFDGTTKKGILGIQNIEANHFYCRVVLTLDEDGTVLYESAGLKPGQYIDEVTLDKVPPAGEHDCTAQFIATDPDTLDDVGKVNVKVKLTVT